MKGRGDRHVRVAERIREEISLILQNRVKDPGAGRITVTDVTVTPDLRMARVFYSVLGPAEQQAATQAALESAAPRLSRAIGSSIRMKYTPTLRFEVDQAIEYGVRISQKLRELDEEE